MKLWILFLLSVCLISLPLFAEEKDCDHIDRNTAYIYKITKDLKTTTSGAYGQYCCGKVNNWKIYVSFKDYHADYNISLKEVKRIGFKGVISCEGAPCSDGAKREYVQEFTDVKSWKQVFEFVVAEKPVMMRYEKHRYVGAFFVETKSGEYYWSKFKKFNQYVDYIFDIDNQADLPYYVDGPDIGRF